MQTIHWIRHGLLPIGVTEGSAPEEKAAKLQERSRLMYGHTRSSNSQSSPPFGHMSRLVRQLLDAMVSRPFIVTPDACVHITTLPAQSFVGLPGHPWPLLPQQFKLRTTGASMSGLQDWSMHGCW